MTTQAPPLRQSRDTFGGHRNILLYKSQQNAHVTEFILSDNRSTCFVHYYHPCSGAHRTVTTASGNRYTVLFSAAIVE